jgi:hypothetical protein
VDDGLDREQAPLLKATIAISDGQAVDWGDVQKKAPGGDEVVVVEELKAVESIARFFMGCHADDAMVGQRLSHYTILEKIGAGGMGEVYRARDEHLPRDVAIKSLPGPVTTRPRNRPPGGRDPRGWASLTTIHDFDTEAASTSCDGTEGATLAAVAYRPLPADEVVRIGRSPPPSGSPPARRRAPRPCRNIRLTRTGGQVLDSGGCAATSR